MSLIDHVLQVPAYGWQDPDGTLIKPSPKMILGVMLDRMNIFKSKKNWSAMIGWFWVLCILPMFVVFLAYYLTWWLALIAIGYGMFFMSTHGTIWYHRYATHRSYKFKNKFWRFITANLVVKVIPDEIYVVSHHVHHAKSDKPGDPYNAQGGFLYCFLADTNHQPIAKDLSEKDYLQTAKFLDHTGIYINSYKQYQKWGSVGHPLWTLLHVALNWTVWFSVFYLIGGPGLAFAIFSGAMFWVIAVRTFNYNGHGNGKDKRKEGFDFNRKDMSINQYRPGLLSGEWHNNHHMYPNSARSGFLPSQIDSAWIYIYLLHKIGGIESYRDSKKQFYAEWVEPELARKKLEQEGKRVDQAKA